MPSTNAENFSTHALAAFLILPIGIWFTCNVFFRFYKAELLQLESYQSSLSFPWRKRVAIDMYFLGAMAVIRFVAEIFTNGKNCMNRLPIYVLYEAAAIVAILKVRKWKLPENLEYILFALASFFQGYLLYAHSGTQRLDVLYFGFAFALNVGIAVTTVLEMANPQNVLAAITKCFFVIVSASWYFTLAEVLYPRSSKKVDADDDERRMMAAMLVPIFFVWNMILTILAMAVIGMIQYERVRQYERKKAASHIS